MIDRRVGYTVLSCDFRDRQTAGFPLCDHFASNALHGMSLMLGEMDDGMLRASTPIAFIWDVLILLQYQATTLRERQGGGARSTNPVSSAAILTFVSRAVRGAFAGLR